MNFKLIVFLFLLHFTVIEKINAQCAMCKATVESSKTQKNSMAKGLNKGIIYLMLIPYIFLLFIFKKQVIQLLKVLKLKLMNITASNPKASYK